MLIPLTDLVRNGWAKPGPTLHVGAHLAEEAIAYKNLGFLPVWWVEGNPSLEDALQECIAPFPRNYLVSALVADKPGLQTLHVASNGQSSSILELGTHAVEHPEVTYVAERRVNATTLDLLRAHARIGQATFVNVDVQGAELMVLKGGRAYLRAVETVYLEVNERELYKGCPLLPEVDEWLNARGFERVAIEMTRHHWGDAVYVRVP